MNPTEAFTRLLAEQLPLVLSFPFEEDDGHVVTANGIARVLRISGSRVILGKFSPFRMIKTIGMQKKLHATFEVEGTTYGCSLEDIVVDRETVAADIPDEASRFLRKCVRVEPSLASPVVLYVHTDATGTRAYPVRDISEHGIGLMISDDLNLDKEILCGIGLPFDGGTFLLTKASVVYKMEVGTASRSVELPGRTKGFAFGIELSLHPDDAGKIRLYVMQREMEIREKLPAL